ncbi:MAG: hypothetical protein S4CHLAM102_00590 [Chlamydiia bacterium]|nr:hypothetical protein [Chlamydiia bacterium]
MAIYNPEVVGGAPAYNGLGYGIIDPESFNASTYEDHSFIDLCQRAYRDVEERLELAPCKFLPLPIATCFLSKLDQLLKRANDEVDVPCVPRFFVHLAITAARMTTAALEVIQYLATLPIALAYTAGRTTFTFFVEVNTRGLPPNFTQFFNYVQMATTFYFGEFYHATMGQPLDKDGFDSFFTAVEGGTERYFSNDFEYKDYKFSPIPVAMDIVDIFEESFFYPALNHHLIPTCATRFAIDLLKVSLVALMSIQFIATLPIASLYVAGKVIADHVQYLAENHTFPSCDHMAGYFAIRPREYFNEIFQNSLNISPIPTPYVYAL